MTTLTVGTSGQEYTTLSAAVAAAHTGDTIDLQPGTYTNDFPGLINGLTIEGVGGIAKLVANAQPSNGKAILDVTGNTTLKNLEISGVTVPDANGAAIRYESGNLVIQNSYIHNNQDGILGASNPAGTTTITGSIKIIGSEFASNGTGTGSTHNIYIGDIASFTLTNSYIHDANTGHEIKSRAENNVITNNLIEDNGSTASYEIDLPNGGNASITGNTIQKSASSGNHVSFAYGEEYVGGSNVPEQKLNAGTNVSVSNNTFVSDQPGADVVWDASGAPFTVSGNSIYGYSQIDKVGHVSSSGFTTLNSRPALSTASPIDRSGGTASTTPPAPTPPAADTTPPTLKNLKQSASGISNRAVETISGTVSDGGSGVAKVEIYDTIGGKTVDLGSAAISNGVFSLALSNLADGSHAFSAVATDNAKNATGYVSAGSTLTVDTIAPVLSALKQSVSGTTTQTSNVLPGTVTDSGSGASAVEIFLSSAGKSTDLGAASLNGSNWSYTASNLTPGTYSFYAVARDNAGNTTAQISTGASETVVAPTATRPTIFSVSAANNALVVKGTAQANTTVTLIDRTAAGKISTAGSAVAGSDGSWTISTRTVSAGVVNTLSASTTPGGTTAGAFIVASTASDKLYGSAGVSDVFAFPHVYGNDVIYGFTTTAASASTHDVIDLSGTGYASFSQLKPLIHGSTASGGSSAMIDFSGKTSITLSGVSAGSLQASDFRFS